MSEGNVRVAVSIIRECRIDGRNFNSPFLLAWHAMRIQNIVAVFA
jgi:hypothetical protein